MKVQWAFVSKGYEGLYMESAAGLVMSSGAAGNIFYSEM